MTHLWTLFVVIYAANGEQLSAQYMGIFETPAQCRAAGLELTVAADPRVTVRWSCLWR